MKQIVKSIFFLATALMVVGCSDDDSLNVAQVTPVKKLYTPQDNTFFNLSAQSSTIFEWEAAKAADNGVVLYDVAFDVENGDFSDPVYVMPSDGKGLQNTLTLSFGQLNRIAGFAGIEPEATAKLKWTVLSSKGVNVQPSEAAGLFEVKRAGGFPSPDELFLTGDATEGGTGLDAAIPFKKTGESTFEIYTLLKPGTYKFVTRNTGTPETFFVEGNKLKVDGQTTVTGNEKVYRLRIDFSDGKVAVSTIDKVEFWFPTYDEFQFAFDYVGNGTWKASDKKIVFKEVSYGREERYKFRFMVTTNGTTEAEWYGSTNADNQRPTSDSPASYFYMVPAPSDHYTNTFKFATEVDNANVDMTIFFNTEVPHYTHQVSIL